MTTRTLEFYDQPSAIKLVYEADQAVGDNGVSRFNEKQLTGRMSAAHVLDAGRRVCGRTSG
jgi:hypothetical protein